MNKYQEMIESTNIDKLKTANVQLKTTDLETEVNLNYTETGFKLLNTLFFKRHRRVLYKPVLYKSLFITGLGLVVTALLIWNKVNPKETVETIVGYSNILFGYVPFIMYFLCNGEQVAKAMFVNCDFFLFNHAFYRESDNILTLFKLRLVSLFKWNGVPTGLLVFFLIVWALMVGPLLYRNVLLLIIMVLSLGIFFSVHTLFMYYIFQPYTASFDAKNPVYSVINAVVYIVCFSLFNTRAQSFWIAPILTLITLVYSLVALRVVHKYATKTFKIH